MVHGRYASEVHYLRILPSSLYLRAYQHLYVLKCLCAKVPLAAKQMDQKYHGRRIADSRIFIYIVYVAFHN